MFTSEVTGRLYPAYFKYYKKLCRFRIEADKKVRRCHRKILSGIATQGIDTELKNHAFERLGRSAEIYGKKENNA